ncbi:reactive intermediate/imine deaminase [Amycolatopsis echigonensis]|uniref:Reactive intermediate/imine deaminase n=2 Tax=Amycolatopsis echigonensis TaxID=2576905 RepID=A0A2N3WRN2_9PSEU|nr:reactive intermediate/imine deaminase [Amycolatopsis niigatensis]
MMGKTAITSENAPKPPANFSQAVRKGNILQVAGAVAFDPATGEIVGDDVVSQTRQVFKNLTALLEEAGSSFADAVMVRVYLTDTSHFAAFNEVYNELIGEAPYAARTTVYVGLPAGLLVEIDVLAVLD